MSEAEMRLGALADVALPALPAMLGPEASEMLGAAAAGAGLRLSEVRARQVSWQPGRSLLVRYETEVEERGSDPGSASFVAYTAAELPAGATILDRGDAQVAAWPLEADPWLPGLRAALHPSAGGGLFEALGIDPGPVRARLRAYRPGRRAVVELAAPGVHLFVKVVRPDRVPALQARHRALAAGLPVPPSHGWSERHGIVVLRAMPGRTLRETLADPPAALPAPQSLADLLDGIPEIGDGSRAPSPVASAREHGRLLRRLFPEMAGRIRSLVAGVSIDDATPLQPVHGDFHSAQLLVHRGEIAALLDVDTVGLGARADDWARLIAHLDAWHGAAPPEARERVATYLRGVMAVAGAQVEATALYRRVAAAGLGLATGPFRVQSPAWPSEARERIERAEQWLACAPTADLAPLDERNLIPLSAPPHAQAPASITAR